MSKLHPLSPEQQKIETSLGWLEPLVKKHPTTYIDIIIRYLEGKKMKLVGGAVWNPIAATRGIIHIRSALAVIDALFNNPTLLLENKIFQRVATTEELWKGLDAKKNDLATLTFSMLSLPKDQKGEAEESISKLFTILAKKVPSNSESVQSLLLHLGVLIDPKEIDGEKKINSLLTLSDEVFRNKDLRAIVTASEVWKLIKYKDKDIASLIVWAIGLNEKDNGQVKVFSELLNVIGETIPANKDLAKKMMGYAHMLIDPEVEDDEKMANLFRLCDKAINFAEKNKGKFLQTLTNNKKAIEDILKHYIPSEIVEKTGINAEKLTSIMVNPKALAALKKAYTQYRDSTFYPLGIIKAVTTIITNPSILKLIASTTVHVAVNSTKELLKTALLMPKKIILAPRKFIEWTMNFAPDFMRRTHAQAKVTEALAKRQTKLLAGQTENLFLLCRPPLSELDPIARSTLRGCFKGLFIEDNLNNFTIDRFNFQNATLGKQDEIFSFAKSKILSTDFKEVSFKTNTVDISGMEIDEKSFSSLLDSLKGKTVIVNERIKITDSPRGLEKDNELKERIKAAGLDPNQFNIIPRRISFLTALRAGRTLTKKSLRKVSQFGKNILRSK
jgi:hypothetical protein